MSKIVNLVKSIKKHWAYVLFVFIVGLIAILVSLKNDIQALSPGYAKTERRCRMLTTELNNSGAEISRILNGDINLIIISEIEEKVVFYQQCLKESQALGCELDTWATQISQQLKSILMLNCYKFVNEWANTHDKKKFIEKKKSINRLANIVLEHFSGIENGLSTEQIKVLNYTIETTK